jgi:glycosyltransferase involved in cell wall biosynthesis
MEGVLQLKRLGFGVQLIGKIFDFNTTETARQFSERHGIPVYPVPYRYRERRGFVSRMKHFFVRLFHPLYWDGSVYEYADPKLIALMEKILKEWRPQIVWFDYTFMLPLYPLARKYGAKIVTHSLIYDPKNVLEEDGRTMINRLRSWFKVRTDRKCIAESDYLFAIAPDEQKMYQRLGAQKIDLLPLRSLYPLLGKNSTIRDRTPLKAFFLGSSYNIKHNVGAAAFLINEVIPEAQAAYPGVFEFYITGGKLPQDLQAACTKLGIHYVGFVNDLESFLADMDIAVIPSLFGTGMQQKIFEPLTRGFPTITSVRGLGEYPFEPGKQMLAADSAEEFVAALGVFRDVGERTRISRSAVEKSTSLFSRDMADRRVLKAIEKIMGDKT